MTTVTGCDRCGAIFEHVRLAESKEVELADLPEAERLAWATIPPSSSVCADCFDELVAQAASDLEDLRDEEEGAAQDRLDLA